MEHEEKKNLSEVRYDHALECLNAAKSLLENGNYKSSANRSYYAIFHAMRAVLAFDEVDMKHHSGIISEFRKRYIKTGVLKNGCRISFQCCLIPEQTAITMTSLSFLK